MAQPTPSIDFANLPVPTEGILVTLFITVRKIARSRCGSGAALLTDLDTSPT